MGAARRRKQPRSPEPTPRQRAAAGIPPAAYEWLWPAALIALLAVTALAYLPIYGATLLHWDDTRYVLNNELLRTWSGLGEFWNPFSSSFARHRIQYYPMTLTSFWIEYRVVGTEPWLYHTTNVALHLANVALVFLLTTRMGGAPWVAMATAGVFALHPMQVESVAWVTERKNVLSGFFYFTAFLLYLRYRRHERRGTYWLAIGAFAAALLAKTQTATLPVVIALYEILCRNPSAKRRLSTSQIAARITPFLGLAVLISLVTTQVEGEKFQPWWDLPTPRERPFVAATGAWFYIEKFLLPIRLAPIYPKWDVSADGALGWLAIAGWIATLAVVFRYRRQITPLVSWGAGQFLISVAPALGLIAFAYQHFAFVADHFLYLSCFGGALALSVLANELAGGGGWTPRRIAVSVAGLVALTVAGILTRQDASHWRDDRSLSGRAVQMNPDSHAANYKYGIHLFNAEHSREALRYLEKAYTTRPPNGFEYDRAYDKYLTVLAALDGAGAVALQTTQELAKSPDSYVALMHRARSHERLGQVPTAVADYERLARTAPRGSKWARESALALDRLTPLRGQ